MQQPQRASPTAKACGDTASLGDPVDNARRLLELEITADAIAANVAEGKAALARARQQRTLFLSELQRFAADPRTDTAESIGALLANLDESLEETERRCGAALEACDERIANLAELLCNDVMIRTLAWRTSTTPIVPGPRKIPVTAVNKAVHGGKMGADGREKLLNLRPGQ